MLAFWSKSAAAILGTETTMKNIMKTLAAAGVALTAMTSTATANVLVWTASAGGGHGRPHHGRRSHSDGWNSHGRGHDHGGGFNNHGGHHGGGAPSAPEIDLSQGAAALVIVLIAFLLIREAYLRQRVAV